MKSEDGWHVKEPGGKRVHKVLEMDGGDWCHVCGYRMMLLARVDTWENAEHAIRHPKDTQNKKHIRICSECLGEMARSVEDQRLAMITEP